jgi:hypothetical protein
MNLHKLETTYPNYHHYMSRAGHCVRFDDTKGKERLIIQARSGSCMMFYPDGAVKTVAHNGFQQENLW